MEKIIIAENPTEQNAVIVSIKLFCSRVNGILPEFEAETNYKLNIDELRSLFFNRNDLTQLVNRVNETVLKGFEGMKITGIIKRTLISDYAEFIYSFANKLAVYGNNKGAEYLQNFGSIENGKLILSEQDEETLRDHFRITISSVPAIEFFEKHKEICQKLTEFSKYVFEKTGRNFGIDGLTKYYFDISSGPGNIQPIQIDYEKALQRDWEKHLR